MENLNNLILSDEQLNEGKVECLNCHNGTYKPLNPNYKVNHSFVCDNCGDNLLIEPKVIVE